jgi:hypothetical protein
MRADTVLSAASSFTAGKRCEAAHHSPICSLPCGIVQFPTAYHATRDGIFATMPIGAHWTVLATETRWFSSFTFRASDSIRSAGVKAVQLLFVRW